MDRSLPKTISVLRSNTRQRCPLKPFEVIAQQYGTYFAGFPWQAYCTGTYRVRLPRIAFDRLFHAYVSRLEQALGAPIAYVATLEHRTSGLGFSAIPSHWHFLLATAPRAECSLIPCAHRLWEQHHGNAFMRKYDRTRPAPHYIAKLASHTEFHYLVDNLDRLAYGGPLDLYEHMQSDPYVPFHVRHRTYGQTLVLRPADAA